MPNFSRSSLFAAYEQLRGQVRYHTEFQDLMYRWELDHLAEQTDGGIAPRMQVAFRWLKDNPESTHDGEFHLDLFVKEALRRGPSEELLRSIARDGFTIEDGELRRTLPKALDLPAADDQVHLLLDRHNFATPRGHLDQGIRNHTEGQWAAANGQFRTFLESLLDEIAYLLVPNAPRGQNEGEARREALAGLQPPFLSEPLREWGNQGKNLLNGSFKYLHTQGAHPGLSNEEDSTFRLHLTLLLGRRLLRRLDARP